MEFFNRIYGFLENNIHPTATLAITILAFVVIGYTGAPLIIWTVAGLAALVGFKAPMGFIDAYVIISVLFNITQIRAQLFSRLIMTLMNKLGFLPKISETE